MACLADAVDGMHDVAGYEEHCFYADCGPPFRCARALSWWLTLKGLAPRSSVRVFAPDTASPHATAMLADSSIGCGL
eukprot:11191446-Lingulodinium_polyedra.AAC.1